MTQQNSNNEKDSFTGLAKYGKGKRTLESIKNAIYELIVEDGMTAVTQEAIALRAEVTQGAVRHYFPTKEEMLRAFFMSDLERMAIKMESQMNRQVEDHKAQLLEIVSIHLDNIIAAQETYFFETASYFARNEEFQERRHAWYQKLDQHFEQLIHAIRPDWSKSQCRQTTYQILTMVMGGWITLGQSRVLRERQSTTSLKRDVLNGVEKLLAD